MASKGNYRPDDALSKVESLAREIYIRMALNPAFRGKTTDSIVQEARAAAEAFYAVQDAPPLSVQTKAG